MNDALNRTDGSIIKLFVNLRFSDVKTGNSQNYILVPKSAWEAQASITKNAYYPANAIDGIISGLSFWNSNGQPTWILIDLHDPYGVLKVIIFDRWVCSCSCVCFK